MQSRPLIHTQQGLALVVGLIFLLLLTLIAITSLNTTSLSEKMTQNLRDAATAFTAAETAMTDGEGWLKARTSIPIAVASCSSPPCNVFQLGVLGNVAQQSASFWQTQGRPYSSSLLLVATQPRYLIEQYSFVPYELSPEATSRGQGYYYYQVTARGTGLTNTAIANVQSIYGIQYN